VPRVDTDVLVVGAGPAGSSAAIAAAKEGLKVLLVERSPHVGDASRSVGFVPRLFADGLALPRILMRHVIRGTRIHIENDVTERQWPGYTIPVRNLFRVLAGMAASSGAELRSGYSLSRLTPTGAARFSSPGGDLEVRAKVVIACDGARSKSARLLELGRLEVLHVFQCEVILLGERDRIDLHMHRNLHGGYAWLYPSRSTASVGVALTPHSHRNGQALLEWFRGEMAKEGLIAPQCVNKSSGAIPCGGIRKILRLGQVILAGDAAGTAHPMAVSGISPALESGVMAGMAAVKLVRGDGDALRAYQRQMHRWLGPAHRKALARRQFMLDAWDRIGFARLVQETCLER
jgi:flavin-dependent dehydrogenase